MLSISFDLDIRTLKAEMPVWAQQRIPSITRNALNDTVEDARFAEIDKIKGVFDRPTLYTQRSPRFTKATKDNLVAEVYIEPHGTRSGRAPADYLRPEVEGGQRKHKAFEKALIGIGAMRSDEYAIPAIGQPRDAYGNLRGSILVRILSQLRAFSQVGFNANETTRSRARGKGKRAQARYFVPAGRRQERGIGRLPRGVYERRGNTIRAVLIFVSGAPGYARRYDFGQATIVKAQRVFPAYWQRHFYAELAKHTAR